MSSSPAISPIKTIFGKPFLLDLVEYPTARKYRSSKCSNPARIGPPCLLKPSRYALISTMLGIASRAWPKNSKQTVRIYLGIRCNIHVALVIKPSHPSFCTPGSPERNLSVTSLPSPVLRKSLPSTSSISERKTCSPGCFLPSDQVS